MKVHKNGQALKTWQNITLLFIELTLPMGFPKIFFKISPMLTLYRVHNNIGRKKIHDFIRHYENGQVKPFELKPIDIE